MKIAIVKIWEKIKNKKHVIGYSKQFRKRIKNGKEIDEEVLRIYVSKKVFPFDLSTEDLIPREINGIQIDVVELGEIKAHDIE
jgi:hypothetical protein